MIDPRKYQLLQCPVCIEELTLKNSSLICQHKHTFDIAKEGYVNLHPVQQKKSLHPGDNEQMVASRRQFLSEGYYDFLGQALKNSLKTLSPSSLLDVGCGNGYFHSFVPDSLSHIHGLDISKYAVKSAAKLHPSNTYLVASSYKIPIRNASMDVVISMLAPARQNELSRVLQENGTWIEIVPGPKHLIQIRERILDHVSLKNDKSPKTDQNDNHFKLVAETPVFINQIIEGRHLLTLVEMTPFYWKSSASNKNNLVGLENLEVTTDFIIRLYKNQT